jgi:hypothetical protein
MSLILSGTDGLSDVDGSAATPAIRGTDTNTGIFFPAADTIAFSEGGVESMRIDSSGNVGIGLTSYTGKLAANGVIATYASTDNNYRGSMDVESGNLRLIAPPYASNPTSVTFCTGTSSTERMRIDSSGNLLVGTTTAIEKLTVTGSIRTSNDNSCIVVGNDANIGLVKKTGSDGHLTASSTSPLIFSRLNQTTITAATVVAGALSEMARFDTSGNLLVGTTSGSNHVVLKDSAVGSIVLGISNASQNTALFYGTDAAGNSTANTGFIIRKVNATGRSINAAGTVNQNGADYAEYMVKAGNFTVAKGDVVGINAEGKVTNVFADAISFCVKSTDPGLVGGDSWGTEEAIGLVQPTQPTQRQAIEEAEAETDEEFAIRQSQYESDKTTFEAALEAARQTVDRIAFCGQVPVNVLGATAGQYIIPVNDNGAIKGEAVSNPTFEQYQIAVGKVIAIESDGRAKIIVKVA